MFQILPTNNGDRVLESHQRHVGGFQSFLTESLQPCVNERKATDLLLGSFICVALYNEHIATTQSFRDTSAWVGDSTSFPRAPILIWLGTHHKNESGTIGNIGVINKWRLQWLAV